MVATARVSITDNKGIWRSEREQAVIDLLVNAVKAGESKTVERMLGGSNRSVRSLIRRKVLTVIFIPKGLEGIFPSTKA